MKESATVNISLQDTYANRHILLTGATGFVGKVLLAMLLQRLPTCERIYILVRPDNTTNAKERFMQLLLSSPAFNSLREHYKNQLIPLFEEKITIVQGDITQPHLGIASTIAKTLYEKLDLVIHLAGLVDFFPSIQLALDINVTGTINTANFVAACDHAAMVHISTCYVAGIRNGDIPENLISNKAPNNTSFNVAEELITLKKLIQECVLQSAQKRDELNKSLEKLGQDRATQWGWTNTYTYTKAMAEYILATQYAHLRYTIIRPSIIESALQYPFAGWNEGFNTCGPYCYIVGSWYPYIISKNDQIIDIIPVDFVCHAILTISASLLHNQHAPVYQIATSTLNPLLMKDVLQYTRTWHRKMMQKTKASWVEKYLRCLKSMKSIPPNSILSPANLAKVVNRLNASLKTLSTIKINLVKKLLAKLSRRLKIIERALNYMSKIQMTYHPFLYENRYHFASNALQSIQVTEKEFNSSVEQIDWKHYWLKSQMPGLNEWVFPSLRTPEENKLFNGIILRWNFK